MENGGFPQAHTDTLLVPSSGDMRPPTVGTSTVIEGGQRV